MRPRRSVYEIIWDIPRYCRTPRKLSRTLLTCNLSTRTVKKYIDLLSKDSSSSRGRVQNKREGERVYRGVQ